MYCILVSGMPASGKSTIAERISAILGLPLLSKDASGRRCGRQAYLDSLK